MSLMLGRRSPRPEETHPRLKLAPFLAAPLPAPPPSVDWYGRIPSWPMYLNDQLGDCVEAEMGHHEQVISAYGAGAEVDVPDAAVLQVYEDVAGYVPGNPATDQGTVIQDALGYWRRTGIAGHKVDAFAQVNVANLTEVKTAVALFGPLPIGINFPRSAMAQFNAGRPWDVVSADGGIDGGHCVAVVGYDASYLYVVTWGRLQKVTPAFWARYVEEAWAVVTREWVSAAGTDPEGVDLRALGDEFAALTGQVNPFPVEPTPTPVPAPPGPVPPPVGVPDAVLAVAARQWLTHHHAGINKTFAGAVKRWLGEKNL